jgi:HK97 gp10 family phage protein
MFSLVVLGADSAERLARKLTAAAVRLAIGAEAAETALAHTVEGLVTPYLRDEAPVDTGALRDSLRAHVERQNDGMHVFYESDVPYADYVEHGTGIYHVPDAHSAWNGHEGQHPNPFAERAYARAEPEIRAALGLAGRALALSFLRDFEGPL